MIIWPQVPFKQVSSKVIMKHQNKKYSEGNTGAYFRTLR